MADRPRIAVNVGATDPDKTLGIAHFGRNLLGALSERDDVEVHVLGQDGAQHSFPGDHRGALEDLRSDRGQRRLAERVDVIVQLHHFLPAVDGPFRRMSVIHDLHLFDVAWKYGEAQERMQTVLAHNVVGADWIFSHFPGTVEALSERYPDVTERLELLPAPSLVTDHVADDAARSWAQSALCAGGDIPIVLYPAQLQAHKNHWTLLAAAAALRAEGLPIRVVFTGSTFREYLTEGLRERARQLGIADLVVFAGFVSNEQLVAAYEVADAVVSPSLAEGGAYVAQEAVHFDKPVAVSRIPNAVAHIDRLGLDIPTFDPLDRAELADALRTLIRKPSEITDRYGPARAMAAGWSWDAMASVMASRSAMLMRGEAT